MSETLYPYYERELLFLRQMAQQFGQQYPAAAGRLMLEPGRSGDPHIERMIESFALLAGRIHYKLDDEFPELTEALLGVLYPHYLAPIPSMAVVQFVLDAGRAPLPNGFPINRGSSVRTNPVSDTPCRFRTCYPVRLWPVELTSARLQPPPFPPGLTPPSRSAAALVLHLDCQAGMNFADLSLQTLRFFLAGDQFLVTQLYELLCNHVVQGIIRPAEPNVNAAPIILTPEECIRPVGFEPEESLLPYPERSFPGYRLLTEFFTFPSKFHFVDLGGLDRACRAGFGRKLEIVLFLNRTQNLLEQGVEPATFRTGCTPIINLFPQIAEPIALGQTRHEYKVVPEVAHPLGYEVYSVDSVTSTDPVTGTETEHRPFYSFRHGTTPNNQQAFYYSSRTMPTRERDRGTDVYLHLVDLNFSPTRPTDPTLIVRTTCTNRALPMHLHRAGEELYFELEGAAPLRPDSLPPVADGAAAAADAARRHWRLISHLCLNHLSLTEGDGREALQEILRLYDFSDADTTPQLAVVTRHLIEGIIGVSSRRVTGRTGHGASSGFARGVEITIEFDEQKYVGSGVYLFASVLERFLGLYVSINSFSQLIARTTQGERYFKKWPPRAGEQRLL